MRATDKDSSNLHAKRAWRMHGRPDTSCGVKFPLRGKSSAPGRTPGSTEKFSHAREKRSHHRGHRHAMSSTLLDAVRSARWHGTCAFPA